MTNDQARYNEKLFEVVEGATARIALTAKGNEWHRRRRIQRLHIRALRGGILSWYSSLFICTALIGLVLLTSDYGNSTLISAWLVATLFLGSTWRRYNVDRHIHRFTHARPLRFQIEDWFI